MPCIQHGSYKRNDIKIPAFARIEKHGNLSLEAASAQQRFINYREMQTYLMNYCIES